MRLDPYPYPQVPIPANPRVFTMGHGGYGYSERVTAISIVDEDHRFYNIIRSQPSSSSSSSSPSTSSSTPTARTSESFTRPSKLHDPKQINARVDCAESRLRT